MAPIDMAQILNEIATGVGSGQRGTTNFYDQVLAGINQRAPTTVPDPANADVGPLQGILVGLADAFQNRARGMAPNPGGIAPGNALDRLTALRQRQAQREDRQNLIQFEADRDATQRQDRQALAGAAAKDQRAAGLQADYRQGVRDEANFQRREGARIAAEDRARVEALRKEKLRRAERREDTQGFYGGRGADTTGFDDMTISEMHAAGGKALAQIKLSDEDRADMRELRAFRKQAEANVLDEIMQSGGPAEGESLRDFERRVQMRLANVYQDDSVGLSRAMQRFEDEILPHYERQLRRTTADRKVEDAPTTGEALAGSVTTDALTSMAGAGVLAQKLGLLGGGAPDISGLFGAESSVPGDPNVQSLDPNMVNLMGVIMQALQTAPVSPHAANVLGPRAAPSQIGPDGRPRRLVVDPRTGQLVQGDPF